MGEPPHAVYFETPPLLTKEVPTSLGDILFLHPPLPVAFTTRPLATLFPVIGICVRQPLFLDLSTAGSISGAIPLEWTRVVQRCGAGVG